MVESAGHQDGSDQGVDCSVLVPVFNEEPYIERSVAAMQRQRFPGRLEFVFADGRSTDRTRELLKQLAGGDPRIRVFDNPNRSVSSGLNVALRNARGRWVARMDAHTTYPEDYLARGVARLRAGDTRWVSGPQRATGDNRVSRAVALALGSPLGRGGSRKWGQDETDDRREYELDAGVFAGVWERATVMEYGGWDERWPRNSDSEMAGRFIGRGERLICIPAMAADYVPRGSLRGLWRQYLDYGDYRLKTAVRHPHTLRGSHLLPPAIVVDSVLAVVGTRHVRRLAQTGLCTYAAAVASAAVRAAARAEHPGDALMVAVVLPVMHLAHGTGMLRGIARHGVPMAALASRAGLDGVAARLWPEPEPPFAPSLS